MKPGVETPGYFQMFLRNNLAQDQGEEIMAFIRKYQETVLERSKRDPRFVRALYAEAISSLREGETDEGLSILRDLGIKAEIKLTA
jgi:hypothetical protein